MVSEYKAGDLLQVHLGEKEKEAVALIKANHLKVNEIVKAALLQYVIDHKKFLVLR